MNREREKMNREKGGQREMKRERMKRGRTENVDKNVAARWGME